MEATPQPLADGNPAAGKHFVISLRTGRLANRLVLFANFIGYAAEHGHRVSNVTFHSYAHLFETTRKDIYCRYPIPRLRSVLDRLPGVAAALRKTRLLYNAARYGGALNERLPLLGKKCVTIREIPYHTQLLDGSEMQAKFGAARTVFVYGWFFRAPGCVVRQAEKIRTHLRPVAELERANRPALERLRQAADVVVGVHIRHGDYRHWKQGEFFFPAHQYAAWMRALAGKFPGRRTAFFVCSDEPRHAGEFPGLTVEFGVGPAVADLYSLAKCDFLIGPLSTFSQWASFYGNVPLFHLRNRDAQIALDQFAVSDLYEIPV